MASSFEAFDADGGDPAAARVGSAVPIDDDDGYLGYDSSQRFDPSYSDSTPAAADDEIPVEELRRSPGSDESRPRHRSEPTHGFSEGPILPPPGEMQREEGFILRQWRLENAQLLLKKEEAEKQEREQIFIEAEAFKRAFHDKRKLNCETNKLQNREREKLFLSGQAKFHSDVDKHYWKAIAELIPNEVPNIEKRRGKKDQENKRPPSIVAIQGPKPGKPTELSRMRHIVLKLKHNPPPHMKPPPSPPAPAVNTKDGSPAYASASGGKKQGASPPKGTEANDHKPLSKEDKEARSAPSAVAAEGLVEVGASSAD